MSNRVTIRTKGDSLASHILPVSGTMIGVSATVIGLVKLAEAKHGSSHVDEYAAMAAVTFLASALTSYLSIRLFGSNQIELSDRANSGRHLSCRSDRHHPRRNVFAYEVI